MSETITDTTAVDEAPPRRLVRVDEGRWLAGVCAGLGRYFDVNPLVYRIAFTALALAGGTGLLLYAAAWLVMPSETSDESIAVEALRRHRDRPWLLLGVGLLSFFAILALSEARFWPGNGNIWLAATLAGAAIVWWHVGNRSDRPRSERPATPVAPAAPREPRRPAFVAPVLGALLVVAGLLGLLAVLDIYDADVAAALAAGVVIVGAAIAFGASTGRRVGGLVVLGLVLLASFGVAAVTPISFSDGIGEKLERPVDASELEDSYELSLGELAVDLSDVELPFGTTEVDVKLGVGEIILTVPEGVALEIDARAAVGEVDVLGTHDEGAAAHERVMVAGPTALAPVLRIDADVSFGAVEVRRR
ncbi:MAG: PspC domain-containing protein [Actinomycetota bacterium]|nr:PspC domain-containing protein [Actinomycetota bacterium]